MAKTKVPKSQVTFFVAMQVCVGTDTGFSKYFEGKARTLLTVFSYILSVVFFVIFLSLIHLTYNDIWFWCCMVKYTLNFFVLTNTKYQVYDFVYEIHNFGDSIQQIDRASCGIIAISCTFIVFITKLMFGVVRCNLNDVIFCGSYNKVHHGLYTYISQVSDVYASILTVIMYYVYCFAANMNKSLMLVMDTKLIEKRYTFIAESWNKIKHLYNNLMIIELCTNTPRLMVTLWTMLLYIQKNAEWYSYTSEWLFTFHLAVQTFIPSIIAEMVNSQIESIKLTLNEQRRIERDPDKLEELTRIIRYIKARKLQGDIWNVVPIDLRLPLALCSFCTTYFIVILQFTHLYN